MKQYDGLILALLFAVFGGLQYNDPDALTWVLIYGGAAVISFGTYLKKVPKLLLWVVMVIFLVAAGMFWPEKYQGLSLENGYTPAIEEARESLGLGICAVGMLWLALRYRK